MLTALARRLLAPAQLGLVDNISIEGIKVRQSLPYVLIPLRVANCKRQRATACIQVPVIRVRTVNKKPQCIIQRVLGVPSSHNDRVHIQALTIKDVMNTLAVRAPSTEIDTARVE